MVTEGIPELKIMVCLPCIFIYVSFLSQKHYFKIPLVLSLQCLWNCSWGLESTVTASLEAWVPGRFHLDHPAIKRFPPLSYLSFTISCDLGCCIISVKVLREAVTFVLVRKGEWPYFVSWQGQVTVQRTALASAQLCTSPWAVPRAGLILSGNWNSHRSLETATVFLENVLFHTFTPLLLPLSVKQCYLIFHGGAVQLNFFCVSSCLSTSYLSQFGRPSRCWATETQLFVLIALNSETGNTSLYAYLQF